MLVCAGVCVGARARGGCGQALEAGLGRRARGAGGRGCGRRAQSITDRATRVLVMCRECKTKFATMLGTPVAGRPLQLHCPRTAESESAISAACLTYFVASVD